MTPTVSASNVQLLVAMAREQNLVLRHSDVEQAFVHAELEKEVFMPLQHGCGGLPDWIVTLNCSLYGSKYF